MSTSVAISEQAFVSAINFDQHEASRQCVQDVGPVEVRATDVSPVDLWIFLGTFFGFFWF
jgi:hypothetical protein